MNKSEDNKIYRIIAQRAGITITAETHETSLEDAKKIALDNVLLSTEEYRPFVVIPVTTKERWDSGSINFCPRCGTNIAEYGLDEYANTECFECDAILDIQIQVHDRSEDE